MLVLEKYKPTPKAPAVAAAAPLFFTVFAMPTPVRPAMSAGTVSGEMTRSGPTVTAALVPTLLRLLVSTTMLVASAATRMR